MLAVVDRAAEDAERLQADRLVAYLGVCLAFERPFAPVAGLSLCLAPW